MDPTGLLEETVQIVLDHDKIDEINNKVLASVDSELAKSERELREKLQEVNDGLQKITDGESELSNTKTKPMTSWRSLPFSCDRRRRI